MPHPFQVEAILPEWVDVGVQQRRGAGKVLVGDHVTLRAELRNDFADPQRVPDHHGVVQDSEAGEGSEGPSLRKRTVRNENTGQIQAISVGNG